MEVTPVGTVPASADASAKSGKKAASGFSTLLAAMDVAGKGPVARSASHDALAKLRPHTHTIRSAAHAAATNDAGGTDTSKAGATTATTATIAKDANRLTGAADVVTTDGQPKAAVLAKVGSAPTVPASHGVAADEVAGVPDKTGAPGKTVAPKVSARAEIKDEVNAGAIVLPEVVPLSVRPKAALPTDRPAAAPQPAIESKDDKTDKKVMPKDLPKAEEVLPMQADHPVSLPLATPLLTPALVTPGAAVVSVTSREVASTNKERPAATSRTAGASNMAPLEKAKVSDEPTVTPTGAFEHHMQAASDKVAVASAATPSAPYEVSIPIGQRGWSDAISKTMVSMLKDGVTEAVVSINPENLGPVDIKISMEKGTVNVDFFSPYAEVREALADGADQLQARFAEAGVRLDRVESHDTLPVMKEEFAQDQRGKQEQSSGRHEQ